MTIATKAAEAQESITAYPVSSVRWEDGIPRNTNVSMGSTENGIGVNVRVFMGNAKSTVCRNLHLGMGHIAEAIVFDKVQVHMGRIDEIHCLHSTEQNVSMGAIGRTTYHTEDELVDLALEKMGME